MCDQTPENHTTPSFEHDTLRIIKELKAAFANIIDALPPTAAGNPTQVARYLKIDTKLSWKVAKLLEKSDPFEAGQYVPGATAAGLFLKAAGKAKVAPELLERSAQACEIFQSLVRTHGGSRRSYDLLLAGHTSGRKKLAEMEHRKTAFQANSYLLGVQAKARIKTYILHPSADAGNLDICVLNAFVKLCRIRRSVPWRLARTYSIDDDGQIANTNFEPLDHGPTGTFAPGDMPIMHAFSSSPLPEFVPMVTQRGTFNFRLADGPVGKTASSTFITGEILRKVEPRYRHEKFEQNVVHSRLATPCETMVFDLLAHKDLFGEAIPEAMVYSDLFTGEELTRPPECDRMEIIEQVEQLGQGLANLRVNEFPPYADAVSAAMNKAGWKADDFNLYRLRMQFPPNPTIIFLHTDLPDRPA